MATTPTNIPDPVSITGFSGFQFIAVAGAGDVNGDGLSDVATGWDNTNNGNGAAYVYLGTASGVATSPTTTLSGPAGTNVLFGKSIE
ncbi:MAG: integrin alpha [Polyangiales bacterium]